MGVKFGPAGQAGNYPGRSSVEYPGWLASQGLDAFEYQCGKGVNVGEETAWAVGVAAREHGIQLSLHAPYFISLANPDPETVKKSIGYVTASCRAAQWMGADRVILHSGALMKRTRREALDIAKANLKAILAACAEQGFEDVTLCPETMGKINQLGNLTEVLELCQVDERLVPCVDFGHLYARSLGALDGADACKAMLDEMADALGEERASRFHSHFSKIAFTPKGGEQKHLRFSDEGWGPEFRPLAEEIARRGWSPTFICESSGTQSEDALTMKTIYQEVSRP